MSFSRWREIECRTCALQQQQHTSCSLGIYDYVTIAVFFFFLLFITFSQTLVYITLLERTYYIQSIYHSFIHW